MHDGWSDIESTLVKEGPIEDSETSSVPRPRNEVRRHRLILVVEDHPDTQSAVAELLIERGWDVSLASDGDIALHSMRENRPELVCLDLNLPNISGYDVCEAMRSDPLLKDIPVLMTSARVTLDVRANSIEAGADVYLAKPFDFDDLAARIEALVASRPAR
jgi:two-component system chemotaxis response regulator CheY